MHGWMYRRRAMVVGVGLAFALLTACGSVGGTSQDQVDDFGRLSTVALTGGQPVSNEVALVVGGQVAVAPDEDFLNGDNVVSRAAGRGSFSGPVVVRGLTFNGTWTVARNPYAVNGNVTVAGTLSGTGTADDGTATDMTLLGSIANNQGTVSFTGTTTPPGSAAYHGDRTITLTTSGTTLTMVSTAHQATGNTVVYSRNVTRTVDATASQPRSQTIDGTVTVHKPDRTSRAVTVTFNHLVFSKNPATGVSTYQSGNVAITSTFDISANLTVQPGGTLAGKVLGALNVTLATMVVGGGTVTVTPS